LGCEKGSSLIQVNAEPGPTTPHGLVVGRDLTPESCETIAAESRRMARISTDPEQISLFLAQALEMETKAAQLRRDQALVWSPALTVGHGGLDAGHIRLMEAINGVCSARYPQQLGKRLDKVKSEIDEHLQQETALLREIQAGSYEGMRKRRPTPDLVKAIGEAGICEHILDHQTSQAHIRAVVSAAGEALCAGLKSWFIEHSIRHDAHLKAIFQAM
jgi:hemerythrin